MADGMGRIGPRPLTDTFGRQVTYLRLSVTDRCDLRCTYCMAEKMNFLPRKDLLTLEELEQIADAFIRRGVTKIRITGGEPSSGATSPLCLIVWAATSAMGWKNSPSPRTPPC